MKQLFLTSSIHAVAHDIAKKVNLAKANKLVFITTAADIEKGDKTWLDDDRRSLVNAGFNVTDYTIVGKSYEQLDKDLRDYDFIYLSGGNTFYLIRQSEETGFSKLVRELVLNKGKIYIGTSAGSIIAGPKCPDYLLSKKEAEQGEKTEGYGFVNFTILPHWGSQFFKERYLKDRLKMAYKVRQVPLLILTDNQYVYVVDGRFEIVDVTK